MEEQAKRKISVSGKNITVCAGKETWDAVVQAHREKEKEEERGREVQDKASNHPSFQSRGEKAK